MQCVLRPFVFCSLLPCPVFFPGVFVHQHPCPAPTLGGSSTSAPSTSDYPNVYYLGPAGTYSEQAAINYFGERMHGVPTESIGAVIDSAAKDGFGVVPYENSLAGQIRETSGAMARHVLTIVDTIPLAIEQCLLSRASSMAAIKRIYSHEVSLMQCHKWLKSNMPGIEQCPVTSNAEAMRLAAQDPTTAAIGGAHGAPRYGLSILRQNIQDTERNVTRFFVVQAKPKE